MHAQEERPRRRVVRVSARKWCTTHDEARAIRRIVARWAAELERVTGKRPPLTGQDRLRMQLTLHHLNGQRLDLAAFAAADGWVLMLEVLGLVTYLDPYTGRLHGGGASRFAIGDVLPAPTVKVLS